MIWHFVEVWLLLLAMFVVGCGLGAALYAGLGNSSLAVAQGRVADAIGDMLDAVKARLGLGPDWRDGFRVRVPVERPLPQPRPKRQKRRKPPRRREVERYADEPYDDGGYDDRHDDRYRPEEHGAPEHDAAYGEPRYADEHYDDYPSRQPAEPPRSAPARAGARRDEPDRDWVHEDYGREPAHEEAWEDDATDATYPQPQPEREVRGRETHAYRRPPLGESLPAVDDLPAESLSAKRPAALAAPRNGVPDNLQRIRGIGKGNEELLNRLGIFHFGQIAAWTPAEARWVAEQMPFPERIERDDWIGQATILASGGETGYVKAAERRRARRAAGENGDDFGEPFEN